MAVRVVYADGPSAPRLPPGEAVRLAGLPSDELAVTLGWTIERHGWLSDPTLRATTVLAGYGLSGAVADGRVIPLPIRLSAVAPMLVSNPPDVAVVAAVRRGDGFAFSGSVGWADVLARVASHVVIEVDEHGVDLGGPTVEGQIVAVASRRGPSGTPAATSRAADELDRRIGAAVAELVPEGATLQFGPGGIGEGIVGALDRPVAIWSGLMTDAMAELHDRGLLAQPAVATYTWGGEPIHRLHAAGMLRLISATITHDPSTLAAIPRFIGCNTALQVGLDGSVNVERIGSRVIAAVGGHSDFAAGAARSPGGLSIVALRSTTVSGRSTIVARVDVVSTQRSDIDVVVTEHGVADLRAVGDDERAARLIAVAAPEHRDELRSVAV